MSKIFPRSFLLTLLLIFFLFSIIAYTHCWDPAGPLRRQLIGDWRSEDLTHDTTVSFRGNGTLVGYVKFKYFFSLIAGADGSFSGTWDVKDTRLVVQVTHSSTEAVKVRHSLYDVIIKSGDRLQLKKLSGDIEEYHRVKRKP